MKYLELKIDLLNKGTNTEQSIKYDELIRAVLQAKPSDGFSPEETKARLRVLDVLDGCENHCLALEDADAIKLQMCVKQMRWRILDRALDRFADDVLAMSNNKKITKDKGKDKV